MKRHLIGTAAMLSAAAAISIGTTGIASASAPAAPEGVEARADFNGDRIADLAIGVPSEDQTGADDGAVNVIYGTVVGLNQAGNQVWSQDSAGIGGVREAGDRFGASLAVGDFDRDGFTDLAIGVPNEDQTGADDGAVNVIYGSPGGLNAAGNQVWDQDSPGIGGGREAGDTFGASLAAGDFDGDGFTDLAIGVPNENQTAADDGAVNVIYGSPAGLNAAGNQVWDQDSPGIGGGREAGDRFGSSLAAANFGNSSHADLAIGVPSEDQTGADDGAVNVIYGSAAGLNAAGNQVWDQDSAGIGGVREAGDRFGSSLAAANFGNSSYADLAIGVPNEDQTGADDGAVNVIYGSADRAQPGRQPGLGPGQRRDRRRPRGRRPVRLQPRRRQLRPEHVRRPGDRRAARGPDRCRRRRGQRDLRLRDRPQPGRQPGLVAGQRRHRRRPRSRRPVRLQPRRRQPRQHHVRRPGDRRAERGPGRCRRRSGQRDLRLGSRAEPGRQPGLVAGQRRHRRGQ